MLVELRDWIGTIIDGYTYSYGQWVESAATDIDMYCVVQAAGGPGAEVDVRHPRFRVILLGRRNERGDSQKIMADADALVAACLGDSLPCGAARLGAGEPSGPGFTTENRAWAGIDFNIIF